MKTQVENEMPVLSLRQNHAAACSVRRNGGSYAVTFVLVCTLFRFPRCATA